MALSKATVPVVATIVGEGGSGGALAIALADRVIMAENAVYSVASPEGCAAILWGDAARAPEAAERLKLTSADLIGFGIVDRAIEEPLGGAHRDAPAFVARVLEAIDQELRVLEPRKPAELRDERYEKFRRIGAWEEPLTRSTRDSAAVTRTATNVLRLAGRIALVAVVACVLALVSIQFEGILAKNVAMAHEVDRSRADIAALEKREREQEITLRRLSTPEGAVPEIHEKLRLVGPHEEIVIVRGATDAPGRPRCTFRGRSSAAVVRGIVINIHSSGALVRLEDGTLAAVTNAELAAHRPAYTGSHARRTPLDFVVNDAGRHSIVTLEGRRPRRSGRSDTCRPRL